MASNILTTAATAASSAEITLTTDTLVALKGAATGAKVDITVKDDTGAFASIGELTQARPSGILPAGIYVFTRIVGAACGVFSA